MSDKIKLELAISDFVDMDYLEENVIRELARTAESKLTGGHTESFHAMCVSAINQAIEVRITARIEETLSKPIPQLDRFGDPTGGDPKTLSDIIAEAADVALNQAVDSYGKPANSSSYSATIPRIEYLVKKVAAEGIFKEAEKVARKVNADTKKHAQDVLANAVAAQLARMAK